MRLLVLFVLSFVLSAPALAQRRVDVSGTAELRAALDDVRAGDEIVLASGRYDIVGNLRTRAAGEAERPITVRSAEALGAELRFDSDGGFVEGFFVTQDHWTFDGLRIEGICSDDTRCAHAWHLVGARNTIIRNNEAFNFNAHIKANGNSDSPARFCNYTLVEANNFYNTAPRQTASPVTPIDVVGGRRFIIRANYIHDFEKAMGNTVSYAAFLKGNGRDGLIERNLVVCSDRFEGGARRGLSFGGGGTGDAFCEGMNCDVEHTNGIMRNNIVVSCSNVGIYINACDGCEVGHNTVFDTLGIDLQFEATVTEVYSNLYSGTLRDRNGSTSIRRNNVELSVANFEGAFGDPSALDFSLLDGSRFVDQGPIEASVTDDYCGAERDSEPDIGAVEYGEGCDTSRTHAGTVVVPPDAGVDAGPADAGAMDGGSSDAGPMDAGPSDGGAGPGDAAMRDTGRADANDPSIEDPPDLGDGSVSGDSGCRTDPGGEGSWLLLFSLLALRRRG
ncbi:MAG: right-handed parallel beta-helix repeat-containing protein [Myxococcota bacterium]